VPRVRTDDAAAIGGFEVSRHKASKQWTFNCLGSSEIGLLAQCGTQLVCLHQANSITSFEIALQAFEVVAMETANTVSPVSRCYSARCTLCSSLGHGSREELARIARIRHFGAGDTVLAEAEEIGFVGHVLTGVLRMQKALHDGRQQIVGLLMPGSSFGRVFSHTSNVAIEAATDVTLCCYRRQSFEALFTRFPEIEHRMLESMTEEIDAAHNWMLMLATLTVTERMATFFLDLHRKGIHADGATREMGLIDVPICRKDFAAYLGTTVESISRSIQHMARERLIRIVDSHRFELLNEDALVHLAHRDDNVDVTRAWRAS
jgi:CRP/FNR family transcriptional regulator